MRPSPRLCCETLEPRDVPATFSISTHADSGSGSLRAAVSAANANPGADTIRFATNLRGTITLTGVELGINDNMGVGNPVANKLAVTGDNASRAFRVGGGADISVDDLTITRGVAGQGGVYRNAGTNLTLKDCTLSDNRTSQSVLDEGGGGGVFVAVTATVDGCTFRGHVAPGPRYGYGGGLQVSHGTLSVTNSNFSDSVTEGRVGSGGPDSEFSTVIITGSIFTNNLARGLGAGGQAFGGDAFGGGFDVSADSTATRTGCIFLGNAAEATADLDATTSVTRNTAATGNSVCRA